MNNQYFHLYKVYYYNFYNRRQLIIVLLYQDALNLNEYYYI